MKMQLTEAEYSKLSEDEKRLYRRKQTRDGNKGLYKIACSQSNNNINPNFGVNSKIVKKDYITEKLLMILPKERD